MPNENEAKEPTDTPTGAGLPATICSPSLGEVVGRYKVSWDNAPPKGGRCALAIGLTPAQHAATLRANVPPGDTEGAKILANIDRITKGFLASCPDGVCSVFVWENDQTVRPEGATKNHE